VAGTERRIGDARVVFTDRDAGDLGHGGDYVWAVRPDVEARRRAVVDLPWTWLRQVHGDRAVLVDRPGAAAGTAADAAVTDRPGCALAVLTADCAPVALVATGGVIAAVHAGWRGVTAGVLERSVEAMRALGAGEVRAVLGPCIRAECYEFGERDLARVSGRLGDAVRARTSEGGPALDLAAAVRAALARAGVEHLDDTGTCTACSPVHFSHRARGDRERQAVVVWRE
jgi:YfiH family protein